jgi:hypothetical protein
VSGANNLACLGCLCNAPINRRNLIFSRITQGAKAILLYGADNAKSLTNLDLEASLLRELKT